MEASRLKLGELLALVKYPLITEKSEKLFRRSNQYTFLVGRALKKPDLKYLFEKFFGIRILGINTLTLPRKYRQIRRLSGKRPIYKKVIIRLPESEKIETIF
jgi:large subunit ribosomal protein L23